MKTKLLAIFVALLTTCSLWAGNTITYTATSKLEETTDTYSFGLHTNAFNVSITSHTFSNGTGTITFSGEVTSIGDYAFRGCSGLTSITIPNSVTSIGRDAFWGCSGLTSITIPNSVTRIGIYAFYNCSGLTSITIPNSVTSIGEDAFSGCTSLPVIDNIRYADTYLVEVVNKTATSCTIKSGTKWIGKYAFSGCRGLTSVTIPNSVTSIGNGTFYGCSGLTSVTIPNSVTSIGNGAFSGCSGLTSAGPLGSGCAYEFGWIDSIPANAFDGCSGLTSITIPNSVTSIGYYAFSGCSGLTSITIPNSVTSIEYGAFSDCTGLTSIVWNAQDFPSPSSLEFLFDGIDSQITSFVIGDNVQSIPDYLCAGMRNLTAVTIPNSVTSIGDWAFYECSGLTSITIPNSVTSIGDYAFYYCTGLTSVTIPNSVTSIGFEAFYGCSGLTSVLLNSQTIVGKSYSSSSSMIYIFGKQVASYVLGDSVTSIGNYAFYYCSGLTSITIPNSVTSIGEYAFYECSGLTSVTIPDGVTSIGRYAFYSCSGLTSVLLNSQTIVGKSHSSSSSMKHIFGSQVTSYVLGDRVTSIGEYAFYYCSGLTSIVWNVKNCQNPSSYDKSPFYNIRSQITSFSFGDDVQSIPSYLCYEMSNLTSITIPNSVTSIGSSAFENCEYLESIVFGSSVSSIGNKAFAGCIRVTDMISYATTTPSVGTDALTSISSYAYLYVPSSCKRKYQVDPNWSRFMIQELAADDVTLPSNQVTTTVGEADVTIAWPTNSAASTYTIQITKGGVVICTLTFDANGVLTNIAFAPNRGDIAVPQEQAVATVGGFQFTITSLEAGTDYAYTVTAKASTGSTVATYNGTFRTNGGTSVLETTERQQATKSLVNGRILIRRGEHTYDLNGRKF